jgi:hypothetical protein
VAQVVEQLLCKTKVLSSNRSPTKKKKKRKKKKASINAKKKIASLLGLALDCHLVETEGQ